MEKKVSFAIGQIIHHRLFDYRGVVFDVDANFQGTDEWYEKNTKTGELPKDEPWYHVLIDDDGRVAYVAQQSIEADHNNSPVDHPLLNNFFSDYKEGHYQLRALLN